MLLSLFTLEGLEHLAAPLGADSDPAAAPHHLISAPHFILCAGGLLGTGEKGTPTEAAMQGEG